MLLRTSSTFLHNFRARKSACARQHFPTDYPVTFVIKWSNRAHAESIRENALGGRSEFNCNTYATSRRAGRSNNHVYHHV